MCFYESEYDIKCNFVSKMCMGLSIDIAIKEYSKKYPGDRIILNLRGKYKKILEKKYKQYCIEPLDEYWSNSQVIFEVTDGIIVNITIK